MLTSVHLVSIQGGYRALMLSVFGVLIASNNTLAQHSFPQLEMLFHQDTSLVFRGISALSDQVVWASSNQGRVVKTEDGGAHWTILKIPGAEQIQFRDIHVFNTNTAVIMGAGWPTRIYKTADGGANWQLVYENNDSAVFLDAFDFWPDGQGICFGDPINGKFLILKTIDFGNHWTEIEGPDAIESEAGFAASGTSLVCYLDDFVSFVSGGSRSVDYYSPNRGKRWIPIPIGMMSGSASKGAFGIAYSDNNMLYVGGDYAIDTAKKATSVSWNFTEGHNSQTITNQLPYQSAAVFLDNNMAISVGTPGCHFSLDAGLTWQKIANMPLHTVTKARTGTAVFAAGPKGRIVKIVFK